MIPIGSMNKWIKFTALALGLVASLMAPHVSCEEWTKLSNLGLRAKRGGLH